MPGAATRRLTSQNRASGRCPRVAARSSSAGSTAANADRAAMIRNGEATNVCASTTPVTVSVRLPPKNSPIGV
jgi:acetylornithine deacetylase/succinyl-diaminopimelate desuccinylase-like protein